MPNKFISNTRDKTKTSKRNHLGVWKTGHSQPVPRRKRHFEDFSYFADGIDSVSRQDLDEFFRRTTIPGLSQIGSRQSIKWRVFWLLFSLAGLSMSLYQSKDVLMDFINEKTTQSITYRNFRKVPFPSLTICSNVRVTIKSKETQSLAMELPCPGKVIAGCFRTEKSNRSRGQVVEADQPLLTRLLALQAKVPKQDRPNRYYGDIDEFVTHCYWKGKFCNESDKDEVTFFQNLLRGSCVTFNPGIRQKIQATESREFIAELWMRSASRRMKFNDVVAMFWLHPAGTAPPLHSQNGGRIFPGDKVRIDFRVRSITRLESDSCISSTNSDYRQLNVYYSDEMPYENDVDNCIFYKETQYGRSKGCFHASVPDDNLAKKLENSSNVLCATYDCFKDCSHLTDRINELFSRECKTLCSELSTTTNLNTGSLIIENIFEDVILNKSNNNGNFRDSFKNATLAIVQLSPESNVIEEVIEEPKYSAADFLGILGGNFGLWVGISIISFAELLELVYMFAMFSKELWSQKQGNLITEHSATSAYTIIVQKKDKCTKKIADEC